VTAGTVSAPGSSFFNNARVWSSERREFVSQKHMDLATVLHDYDPNFELVYVPEHDRDATDVKPFAILSRGTEATAPHIVRYLSEAELAEPHKILAWIRMGDLRYNDPKAIIERIEAEEAFERLMNLKREEEETQDRIEKMAFLASGGRDRKNYIRHNGVTIAR